MPRCSCKLSSMTNEEGNVVAETVGIVPSHVTEVKPPVRYCGWCTSAHVSNATCKCHEPCGVERCPMVLLDDQPTYGPFGVRYDDERKAA
jgi:hypothetical protein